MELTTANVAELIITRMGEHVEIGCIPPDQWPMTDAQPDGWVVPSWPLLFDDSLPEEEINIIRVEFCPARIAQVARALEPDGMAYVWALLHLLDGHVLTFCDGWSAADRHTGLFDAMRIGFPEKWALLMRARDVGSALDAIV